MTHLPPSLVPMFDDDLKIYLAGPMTGLPQYNYPAFNVAAALLRKMSFTVINPAELAIDPDAPWHEHMRRDIAALVQCDAICMLPGWENSTGARLEHQIAKTLGFTIIYSHMADNQTLFHETAAKPFGRKTITKHGE